MKCDSCGFISETENWCRRCAQFCNYVEKYPDLKFILDEKSIDEMNEGLFFLTKESKVNARCTKCQKESSVELISLLKNLRKKLRNGGKFEYLCHLCSKSGDSEINIETVKHIINFELTAQKFGGMPKNVKLGYVVAECEDCHQLFDVKLGNLLHQARRHKANGRTCLYKCFTCGIKREDAVEKSVISRQKQLSSGFKSSLEIATENRLKTLGVKYECQYKVGIYCWDFFLLDHQLLIDVQGEYWHSLKERIPKDKAKKTYTERYYDQYQILYIEEKNFLNPLMVDRIILNRIGISPIIIQNEFDFSNTIIKEFEPKDKFYVNFLKSYHYSMCGRYGKTVYGAFLNDELIAVCKFNSITRREVASSMDLKIYQVLELDRFCIHPNYQKKNFASWMISRCSNLVFEKHSDVVKLVSFADKTYGHQGTIYKASNWTFLHETKPSYHYMDSLGVPINKKRVFDIASKFRMKENEYAEKHNLQKFVEEPKLKFVFDRK